MEVNGWEEGDQKWLSKYSREVHRLKHPYNPLKKKLHANSLDLFK